MKTVPTGFSFVPPPGPAMPVTAMAKSAPSLPARAFGHFARHRFAHRAVRRQRFGANAEKFLLRFVAVSHEPAQKNRRRARHIRHAMRDAAAGAGFGQRQSLSSVRSKAGRRPLPFPRRQNRKFARREFFERPLPPRGQFSSPFRAARRQPHVHLPRPRAIADFQPGGHECAQRRLDFFLHQRFGDAARPQRAADKRRVQREFAPEQRHDKIVEHRAQLARRAGQHHQPFGRSRGLEHWSLGRCARWFAASQTPDSQSPDPIFIASPGAVPFGLASTSAPSGTSAWTSLFFGIGRLRAAKRFLMWSSTASSSRNFLPSKLRNQIARQIVGSRAEAAGGDDQIRAAQRFANGGLDVVRRVRHGHLAGHDITEIGEAAAEPLLVRVEHATEHQFAAGVEQFDVHPREFPRRDDAWQVFAFGIRPSRGKKTRPLGPSRRAGRNSKQPCFTVLWAVWACGFRH